MVLEEVVEGTPLDILFPAKHRYHLETNLLHFRPFLSHSFSCIPRMLEVRSAINDDHSVPLMNVVLKIVCPEIFELPKPNIG